MIMVDVPTTSAFYSARPSLILDGQEGAELARGLHSLSVHETTAGLYSCEATFGNWGTNNGHLGFLYFDRRVLDFGRTLCVEMGDGDAAAKVFEGKIMAIEGRFPQQSPPEILVLADDRLQDLRMIRRSRSFDDVSTRDVITQIAGEHGLATDIDIDGPTYRVLTQVNQSDLAFLRECARAVDAELWIDGNTLYAQSRSRRQTEELSLSYGHRLKEFAVIADLARQRTSLTVHGWSVESKEAIAYESDETAIKSEMNGGQSGSALLKQTCGQRMDMLVHHVPLSLDEAQSLANAHYRSMARQFLTGQALAEGDGRLRAGSHIHLDGLGPLFDGRYYVNEVRHIFDSKNGYRTYFRVERPDLGSN